MRNDQTLKHLPLWTAEEIARAIHVTCPAQINPNQPVTGISIDSRTLNQGDLFIPIIAERDGHEFIDHAINAGAALVIASQTYDKNHPKILKTPDHTQRALEKLAIAARKRTHAKIIAVTGSVGKTTLTQSIRTVLDSYLQTTHQQYTHTSVHASEKSFNNYLGVPLSVARMHKNTQYAVFEIGMNAPGEITSYGHFITPHVAVITNVGPVHLENFQSVEHIADAKAEIFNAVNHNATAILNADSPYLQQLKKHAENAQIKKIITFGANQNAQFKLTKFTQNPNLNGGTLEAIHQNIPFQCSIAMNGKHAALNILALCAALHAANIKTQEILPFLNQAKTEQGRGNIRKLKIQNKNVTIIDESYNANPMSMRAALENLKQYQQKNHKIRRIAILGDMMELGQNAEQKHQELKNDAINAANKIYLCGKYMKALWEKLPKKQKAIHAENPDDIYLNLKENLKNGDVIMIKASRAIKIETIIRKLEQENKK